MFQIYTGNGKGKTTAALGLAIRALGAGKKVGWICFDKGGTHYSERKVLDVIANLASNVIARADDSVGPRQSHAFGSIDFRAFGLDRIDSVTGRFRFGVTAEDITEAEQGLTLAGEWITSDKYDLIILDEINSTVDLGMLKKEAVLELLSVSHISSPCKRGEARRGVLELIFTGRNAPTEFLDCADLVTEMKLVKHYFYRGVRAREGFDY